MCRCIIHHCGYIDLHGHRFAVLFWSQEIHDNVDMVMGIKHACEIEGGVSTRDSSLHILNRLIPFFPQN